MTLQEKVIKLEELAKELGVAILAGQKVSPEGYIESVALFRDLKPDKVKTNKK